MYAPLIPHCTKADKEVQWRRQRSVRETPRSGLLTPSHTVDMEEGAALKDDASLSFHPLLLSWICIPFLTVAIIILKRFTSLASLVLFLPCFVGMGVFFVLLRVDLVRNSMLLRFVPAVMMVSSSAQLICDVALAFFLFLDAEFRHRQEDEIQNREVYVGASVLLCMAHTLCSVSVFADFYLSWHSALTATTSSTSAAATPTVISP